MGRETVEEVFRRIHCTPIYQIQGLLLLPRFPYFDISSPANMTSTNKMFSELDGWHIQCIYPALQTPRRMASYAMKVNLLLDDIWGVDDDDNSNETPTLEVAEVQDCTDYKGQSTVQIRFQLHSSLKTRPEDVQLVFQDAARYFCERVFDLYADGTISRIGYLTTQSLLGIEPQSPTFRYYWTKTFLRQILDRDIPSFNLISNTNSNTAAWTKGITLALALLGEEDESVGTPAGLRRSELVRHAGISLSRAAELNSRGTTEEQRHRVQQLASDFILKSQSLQHELEYLFETSAERPSSGNANLTKNAEASLFNTIFDILNIGFDLLTVNVEFWNLWQKVTNESANGMCISGGVAVFPVGAFIGDHFLGFDPAAIYGLMGVAAVDSVLLCTQLYFHHKFSTGIARIKNRVLSSSNFFLASIKDYVSTSNSIRESRYSRRIFNNSTTLRQYILSAYCLPAANEARGNITMGYLETAPPKTEASEQSAMIDIASVIGEYVVFMQLCLGLRREDPYLQEFFTKHDD